MILLRQNIEDYNNDFRVSLQAFYGGERIVIPEIFDRKPELAGEVDKVFVADVTDDGIAIRMYEVTNGLDELESPVCSAHVDVAGNCHDKAAVRNP